MSEEVKTAENDAAPGGRGCMVVMGILCIVTGLASMGAPLMTGSFVTGTIGILLMAVGILELISAFSAGGWKAGVPAFLGGVFAFIAGGLLIANPVLGAGVVSVLLIAFFLVDGIVRCILAFKLKPLEGWGWALAAGVASVILGVLFWQGWPLSGLWAMGVLIGIRMLFAGFTLIMLKPGTEPLETM